MNIIRYGSGSYGRYKEVVFKGVNKIFIKNAFSTENWELYHAIFVDTVAQSRGGGGGGGGGGGVLTIFWVTGRLGPFDPPFSTYVEFWPLLLGSDVEYWPPFFQAL